MNFDYLVESLTQEFKDVRVTKQTSKDIIRFVFDEISEVMSKGQSVGIRGFGTFKVVEKKGRVYIEPRNQTAVEKGPSNYPKFVPSQILKDIVNGEGE